MLCILGSFSGRDVKGSSEQRGAVFFGGGVSQRRLLDNLMQQTRGGYRGEGRGTGAPPLQLEKIRFFFCVKS